MTSRPLAELAADAVQDDSRQDDGHAGDSEQVRQVLRRKTVVRGVAR